MEPKTTAYIELALLGLALVLFAMVIHPKEQPVPQDSLVLTSTTTRQAIYFPTVFLEARSAYVYDVRDGKVIFEKEPELQWPLASLTKVMSAYVASRLVPAYTLVRITRDDIREEGDSGLLLEEEWNIRKLIDYSLIVSSNDGMKAIASVAGSYINSTSTEPGKLFIEKMNMTARELGMTETYFINQSGLDVSKSLSGGYGSAKDMTLLIEYILKHDPLLLEATSYKRADIASKHKIHLAENTNKSIVAIPNVIASKTGYTDLSAGNVVVAWNAGLDHPIIISILGSSYDGRFKDLDTLVNATISYLSQKAGSATEQRK